MRPLIPVIALFACVPGFADDTLVFDLKAKTACTYSEVDARYRCERLDEVALVETEARAGVPEGVKIFADLTSDKCVVPGLLLTVEAEVEDIKVLGGDLSLIVDGDTVVPTLFQGNSKIAVKDYPVTRGTRFELKVIDTSATSRCWSARTIRVDVPLEVGGRRADVSITKTLTPHPDAFRIAVENVQLPALMAEPRAPEVPEGYNGIIPEPPLWPMLVGAGVGAGSGALLASLILGGVLVSNPGALTDEPTSLALIGGACLILVGTGAAAGYLVTSGTEHPRAREYRQYEYALAQHEQKRARYDAQQRQLEAYASLREEAGLPPKR